MTAIHIDIDDASPPHSGTAFFDCRGARVRAKTDTGLTVISISGEIDASNVDDVSRHACELVPDCGALIIDLADIDFIALDGLRAMFALNIQCARTRTTWALIASHAVNRLTSSGRSRHPTARRRIGDRGPTSDSPIRPRPPITPAR